MNPNDVMTVGQQALLVGGMVAAPMLVAALVVGFAVSIIQAATQINEQTLSFIPKLIAVFVSVVIAGPWMLSMLTDFMRRTFSSIAFISG